MNFRAIWQWTWKRLTELAVAMGIVYIVTAGLEYREDRRREDIQPDAWFEVHTLFVPDHVQGSNPALTYERTIKTDFTGLWVVEAQKLNEDGLFENVCSGDGFNDYDVEDVLPDPLTWTWFFDRECAVEPGSYRIAVVWDMRRSGYPMKRQRARSNLFTVMPQ